MTYLSYDDKMDLLSSMFQKKSRDYNHSQKMLQEKKHIENLLNLDISVKTEISLSLMLH